MSKTTLEQVKEFHEVFGHPVAEKVGEESLKIRQLRIKLLFEELKELVEATDCKRTFIELCDTLVVEWTLPDDMEYDIQDRTIYLDETLYFDGNNVDHVAELDALCDLQVVLDGKFLTSGHWKVKDEAFAEVHRSNMSKALIVDDDDSKMGIIYKRVIDEHSKKLSQIKSTEVHTDLLPLDDNTSYVIFKRPDGKILKGPNFEEPNLKQFVK